MPEEREAELEDKDKEIDPDLILGDDDVAIVEEEEDDEFADEEGDEDGVADDEIDPFRDRFEE